MFAAQHSALIHSSRPPLDHDLEVWAVTSLNTLGMSHSTDATMALLPELKRRLSQLSLDTPAAQAKIPRREGIASESSASEATGSAASRATAYKDTTEPEKAGCTGSPPYSEAPPRHS